MAAGLSKRRQAGYMYVFDDGPPTFTHLPALWDAETAAVAAVPDDPCDLLDDLRHDITRSIEDREAEIASASGADKSHLIEAAARLTEQHAEITLLLDNCRQG